ncbi:hypothetical protein MSAN_00488100 [Mycena sanguinolenta]|uniref:Uncharacterized protein n=1 Tax=Mycena sanguinolenta TaxID=230812 RepID=A0A8H7DIR1_9AGAR|nr:hypothetical protein MSAN_00488100 [Mycena sanguinolenta]
MSIAPQDPWLERSRLDGMTLDGFTYGIFFLLTIQAGMAVYNGAQTTRTKLSKWRARGLMAYIVVTFLLGTVGFAANARYTEDIWINFRGTPDWDPVFLITNEFDFWYNRLAVDTNLVMVWLMNLLLLYRCFVIWNYNRWVVTLMTCVYLTVIGLTTATMVSASNSAVFFNLDAQMAFLVMSCTFNLLFTTLVSVRLLSMRNQIKSLLGPEHALTYTSVTATLVESASLYFVFDVLFVITFSIHSNVENLILLENCLIQGIAQLLIIKRVAQGNEIDSAIATHVASTKIHFRAPVTANVPSSTNDVSDAEDAIAISVPMAERSKSESASGVTSDLSRDRSTKDDSLVFKSPV